MNIFPALLLSGLAVLSKAVLAEPMVEIFTDQAHPISVPDQWVEYVAYFDLDRPQAFVKSFAEGIPVNNPELAEKIIKQRVLQVGGETFSHQLQQAHIGILRAFVYRLDRYPAIVFDRKWVVYGVTDLQSAIEKHAIYAGTAQP
jgi:integrating conjugative element protein (TIGR03757 family)